MTDLEALSNTGSGSISSANTFRVDSVNLDLTGAGEVQLEVEANQLDSSLSGAANVSAFNLITETTIANLSGAGNAEMYVNQLLDVTLSGAGSVYYEGNPTIIQNNTGSGSLIDDNGLSAT